MPVSRELVYKEYPAYIYTYTHTVLTCTTIYRELLTCEFQFHLIIRNNNHNKKIKKKKVKLGGLYIPTNESVVLFIERN